MRCRCVGVWTYLGIPHMSVHCEMLSQSLCFMIPAPYETAQASDVIYMQAGGLF